MRPLQHVHSNPFYSHSLGTKGLRCKPMIFPDLSVCKVLSLVATFLQGETVEIEIEVTEPGDGESIRLRSLGGSVRDDSLVIASGDEAASLLKTPPLERKGKPQRRRHSSRPGQEAIDVRILFLSISKVLEMFEDKW